MGWEAPEAVKPTGKTQSVWRRMRASVADALSKPKRPSPEAQPEPRTTEPAPSWTPIGPKPPETASARTSPSVEDAIAEYAMVIRTNPDACFITVQAERRVDPSSLPGWEKSVHAFEDHDVVKTAIKDRWEEEQEKAQEAERRSLASEKFRAAKRARILAGLDAGELIARRRNKGWVIEGRDEDLVFFANRWSDHPQLAAAYQQSHARRPPSGTRSRHVAPALNRTVRTPALPAAALSAAQASASASRSSFPAQGYTLGEQQWMRDRQFGRDER
jgi:hypothetical protein